MNKSEKLSYMIIQMVLITLYVTLVRSADSTTINPSTSTNNKTIISTSTNLNSLTSTSTNLNSLTSTSTNLKSLTTTSTNLNSFSSTSTNLASFFSTSTNINSISTNINSKSTNIKSTSTNIKVAQLSTIYSGSSSLNSGNQTISSSSTRNENNNGAIIPRKSSSALSTGAICAIAIPAIAALLGVATAAALMTGSSISAPVSGFTAPSLPEPNFVNTSLEKFKIAQVPIQQPQPPQPVQIIEQPRPIQIEPIKEVPRPNYPVNRVLEPGQNISPQQIQMVPVQEVQMVPVQEVQMVPVEEVQMVPVQQMATIPEVNAVPLQQIAPMNQVIPIGQAPQAVPQGQLGNELISSSSQFLTQNQVLPTQVLPTTEQGAQALPSQFIHQFGQGNLP